MLFDLRGGRRGSMVKVVYAVLAILMGTSLFLTVGPFSISEIFNSGGGSTDLAKPYEEEAERIEERLAKDPSNPDYLLSLTRSQINAGNAEAQKEANGEVVLTTDSVRFYQEADQTWSEYLKATKEPNAALAALVGPMMLSLAELSTSYPQADQRITAATEAQQIVAEARPSVNALSTLAFYTFFTGDFAAAEKARAEAKELAKSKTEREEIDKALDEYKKNATKYVQAKKEAEKAQKAAGGKAPENLENPLSPGLGTGGLGG
jgi:tetratricopeptide (TPR) repeat protein